MLSKFKRCALYAGAVFIFWANSAFAVDANLLSKAEEGDAEAQYDLAFQYSEEKNYKEAFKWAARAAKSGNLQAKTFMAICYEDGLGTKQNITKAFILHLECAQKGETFSQYCVAEFYSEGKHTRGKANPIKAFEWYRKAADQGLDLAQYELAMCYRKGYGTAKNQTKAFEYLQKAARQGHARAQVELGKCYEFEWGTDKDLEQALLWYKKSAEQNHPVGQLYLAHLLRSAEFYKDAFDLYNKSAAQDNRAAMFYLGNCHYFAWGTTKNDRQAIVWWRRAADKGHPEAQFNIGHAYLMGEGYTKNLNTAISWFRKSAQQGDDKGQYFLGLCYYYGYGIKANRAKAKEWIELSAQQGYEKAQSALNELF